MATPSTRFVKVTSGFVLGVGRPHAVEGDVLELPTAFAREMIASGKAEFCDPPSEAAPVETTKVETPVAKKAK